MLKQLRHWMLPAFLVLLCLLVLAWALVMQPLLPGSPGRGQVEVDPSRLEAHVRMLTETFIPRNEAHPENLDRAAEYIRRAFERAGGRSSQQPYQVNGQTYRNVIAIFGADTRERIVIGAHYDSVAADVPGADDNASGVAGLIELARMLSDPPPPMRVELVAYTLEEGQHFRTERMGSAVHAASLKANTFRCAPCFRWRCWVISATRPRPRHTRTRSCSFSTRRAAITSPSWASWISRWWCGG